MLDRVASRLAARQLELIEFGFKGLDDFDMALRELLRGALETAAAHESERMAVVAAAIERSIVRLQRRSCDTTGSSKQSGSWRDGLSLTPMPLSSRSPGRVTASMSRERPRRRSAEEGPFDRVQRWRTSSIDGTRTGLPVLLTEPSRMSMRAGGLLRRASGESGIGSVSSLTSKGGTYTPAMARLPSSTHAHRRGSDPARPSERMLGQSHVQGAKQRTPGLNQFTSAAAAASPGDLSAARAEDHRPSTPQRGRQIAPAHAMPMPHVHEDQHTS
jgi:hypothetical protein